VFDYRHRQRAMASDLDDGPARRRMALGGDALSIGQGPVAFPGPTAEAFARLDKKRRTASWTPLLFLIANQILTFLTCHFTLSRFSFRSPDFTNGMFSRE
jgi:hypothetical protein